MSCSPSLLSWREAEDKTSEMDDWFRPSRTGPLPTVERASSSLSLSHVESVSEEVLQMLLFQGLAAARPSQSALWLAWWLLPITHALSSREVSRGSHHICCKGEFDTHTSCDYVEARLRGSFLRRRKPDVSRHSATVGRGRWNKIR